MDTRAYEALAERMLNKAFAFVDGTLRFSKDTELGDYLLPIDRGALERGLLRGFNGSYDLRTLRDYLNVRGQEEFLLSIQPWVALVVDEWRQARGL